MLGCPEEERLPPEWLPEDERLCVVVEGRLLPPKLLLLDGRFGTAVEERLLAPLYLEEGRCPALPILPGLMLVRPSSRIVEERVAGCASTLVTDGRVRSIVMLPGR